MTWRWALALPLATLLATTAACSSDDEVGGTLTVLAEAQVLACYPAVALADAPNPEAAAAFVAFLTGTRAQNILRAHGFGSAPR